VDVKDILAPSRLRGLTLMEPSVTVSSRPHLWRHWRGRGPQRGAWSEAEDLRL